MKITLAVITTILLCTCNTVSVPTFVKKAFSKIFPEVGDPKWDNENGNFEANFKSSGINMSALFDANGNWLETESTVPFTEMSANINLYMQQHYKNKTIKDVSRIVKNNGIMNYEAGIDGKDILFDKDGNFIKEIIEN